MTTRNTLYTNARKTVSVALAILLVLVLVPAAAIANESLGGGASELTSGENTGSTSTPTTGGAGDTNNTQVSGGTEGNGSTESSGSSNGTEGSTGTEDTNGEESTEGSGSTEGTEGTTGTEGAEGTEGEESAAGLGASLSPMSEEDEGGGIQALGGFTPLDAGTITSASIRVLYDGEGFLDADSTAGNDSSRTNKIVRNNDYITYELHYVAGTDGEVTTVVVLPDGMEWDASALQGALTGSGISTDGKTLTAVRDVSGAANLELKARVYNHDQGDTVTLVSAEIGGVEATGASATTVTVSAAPNYRVTMNDRFAYQGSAGPNQDASNNYSSEIGEIIQYALGIYAVIDPNKGVKGIAPLDSCTFEVETTVATATHSMNTGVLISLTGFPSVFSGSQSYAEKGLVNTHTITFSGFDTSFRNPRVTTAYGGDAVRTDAYYVKTLVINFWAPTTSFSTTGTTANTTTLLSSQPGVSSGTPGDESFADDGMRNTNKSAVPKLSDVMGLAPNGILSISGNSVDLHRGETFRFGTQLSAGAAMPDHSNVEVVGTWDEKLATFDPRGTVANNTINGYTYTVMYAHVDDINDPSTFASATWSTTTPAADSNINAVKLVGSTTATITAGMTPAPSIPLVVKSDAAVESFPTYSFYTSAQQSLTSRTDSVNINAAGIDVDLAWQNEFSGSNVQTPGSVQVLKMTPWVAGNNAGTYNSRNYLTPTTGTAQNLQVVVTIPNAAHLLVDESALIAALSTTYPGLGASVASAVVGESTVLTFSFASPVTHNGALPTLDIPVSATIGTTTGTYDATAVISSSSDNINQNYRQDSARISFNQLQAFAMQKTADKYYASPGDEVTWALRYVNFSTKEATDVVLVDVLPYAGDVRGTTGITAPLVLTAVNAGSAGVEYTTETPADVVTALGTDATGNTGITWVSGTPASSDGATALRFTVGTVALKGEGSVTFTTKVGEFERGGALKNDAWGTTAGLPTFRPAAPSVVSLASLIDGKVYKDTDFSGAYTNAMLDDLQGNVVVTLSTTDATLQALLVSLFGSDTLSRTTDLLGTYRFADLPAGNYTVSVPAEAHYRFIEPAGVNTHIVALNASDSVTRDFGLQATRWNLAYDVNTPAGATATGVTLPDPQPNISTASASTAVGTPTGVPVRSDGGGVYAFAGWATTAVRANAGTVDYVATATVPAQVADTNYVLFAVWTYTATSWDLVFDANTSVLPVGANSSAVVMPLDQTGISTASASTAVSAPTGLPTLASGTFGFAGWNTASDGTGTAYATGATVPKQTADTTVTLYAQWAYTGTFWNLTYNLNAPADATGSPAAPAAQSNIPTGSASGVVGTISGQYPKSDGSGYYTFAGWATTAGGDVVYAATDTVAAQAAGVTYVLYAKWTSTATYWDLTFDANTSALPAGVDGSAINVPAPQTNISTASGSASFGAPANLPAVASGTFGFAGWNTEPDGSGIAYAAGATVPKQTADTTVTLYAQWNYGATFWNLAFDLNAPVDATGSPVAPAAQSNIPTGNASGAVGTITGQYPKTDGSGYYTFNQWASGKSGAVTLYGATDTVAAQGAGVTKTLYGTWELTLNSFGYTVTHHFVGGPSAGVSSVVETGTRAFGSVVSAAPSPYIGYTHNAGHPLAVPSGTVGTGGLALHLYYQALSYTVAYNANGGAGAPGTQSGDYLSSVTVAGQGGMTRAGYSFLGWSEDAGAGTPAWGAGGSITLSRNYTLYAVWSLDPTYSLTYAAGGDNVTGLPAGATGLAAGTGVTVGVAPARTGFVFVGWASSAGGTLQPADYFTMPAANVTLTALWEPASFSVSYAAGGTNVVGLPAGGTFEVGATVTVGAAPSRAGFTFEGWASSLGGTLQPGATFVMPTADVTLTATWDEIITPATTPTEPLNPTPTTEVPGANPVVIAAADAGIPIVNIFGNDIPLIRPAGVNAWSLFDLICTLITLLTLLVAGIYAVARKKGHKDDEHEVSDVYVDKDGNVIYEIERKMARPIFLLATALAAAIAVVLFLWTQDLSAPMVVFDVWSIVFGVLAVLAVILARITFGKKKEDYEPYEPQEGSQTDQPAAGVTTAA